MAIALRQSVRELFARRFFVVAFAVSVTFALLALGLIMWQLYPDVRSWQVVALHYNIHFGIDRTGGWWQLFVPAGGSLAMTLANFAYATWVVSREEVIAYAFAVTAVLVSIIAFLHTVFIVSLNLTYA